MFFTTIESSITNSGTRRALLAAGLCLLAAAGGAADASGKDYGPCPQIRFSGAARIELTPMEVRLVCGDPATEGWEKIPFNQAERYLKAFLQQRGYQEPRFVPGLAVLVVYPGGRTKVETFTVAGLPPGLDPRKLRKIKGRILTPELLDSAKAALSAALQHRGYACPAAELRANSTTGEVSAEVRPGEIYRFAHISAGETPGPELGLFRRYEAFRPGQRFDPRLLELTARRTMADSVFMSAYFDVACSTAGLAVTGRVVAGKPQLYRLGFGFDTEGLLLARAQWQNSRLGTRAHSAQASLYASFREQTAVTSFKYYTGGGSRFYLMPRLTFSRQNEDQYEALSGEAALLPGFSWDSRVLHGEFTAGPALEHVDTVRGLGPDSRYTAFETRLELRSHLFEYYAGDPRTGWRASLTAQSRVAGIYSGIEAHRLDFQGERIWNLGSYEPPLLVLATRWQGRTTLVKDSLAAAGELPLDMRYFLGGDSDLRGARRLGVPGDPVGLLTTLYDGVELRLGDVLPYRLQPLVFVDAAMGGRSSLKLDPNVYWSPGFGVRWGSPVGSVRATLARGLVWRRDPAAEVLLTPQWRFFLSLGREF
jgi:translocation and assembly module TamA